MKHIKKFNESLFKSDEDEGTEYQMDDAINKANLRGENLRGELKLYYFNPNDYGDTFGTMAHSKEEAIQFLLKYLEERVKGAIHSEWCITQVKKWSEVDVNDANTYPDGYTIEEYSLGEVLIGEIS
jgi:hypothetical protein